MPTPLARKSSIITKSSLISDSVKAAVGSSKTMTLASMDRALAISTICCLPTVRLPTFSEGLMSSFKRSKSSLAFLMLALSSRRKWFLTVSRPIKIFWATLRWFIIFNSWWTMTIPASMASIGRVKATGLPW